jgi:hypothetical protein
MSPPLVPRLIITAIAAPADYESVVGDLHEEYARRAAREGRAEAQRWYWSQALRSIPSLLSYSRAGRSPFVAARTVLIAGGTVIAMLVCYEGLIDALSSMFACSRVAGQCTWQFFVCGWAVAALFGAMLSAFVRSQSICPALFASVGLVASVAVPTAFGYSSPLPLIEWILLLSVIPAMSAGSAIYQIVRRR